LAGELVYTGVERTPVSVIVQRLTWRGGACPVASELFATVADAYVLLGDLPEDAQNTDSADGRRRTKHAAHARMARMICADTTDFSLADAMRAATAVRDAQVALVEDAIRRVATRLGGSPRTLLLSGHGEFLLRDLADRLSWNCQLHSLSQELGAEISRCAPAHALAVLAIKAWES
jgi:probable H4MPT-linked C1 transfer pathway protein